MADHCVLHVSQPVDGGVARCVLQMVEDQTGRGWRVVVACPAVGALAGAITDAGAEHRSWSARRFPGPGVAGEVADLARTVRAVAPDVVHLHSSKAGLAGRLAVRGRTPTIFQPHGWAWQALTGPLARAAAGWERLAAQWTDLVIAVSEAERTAGLEHGVRGNYAVIPNGVALTEFRPADRRAARQRLGLPDAPTAVCVGRLSRQKGQVALVRAWGKVLADLPAARLVLVGDGPSRARVAAVAAEHALPDAVVLAGERGDVADWYAAADVVVLPSLYGEAMPLVPLEAQACGRAVVASDVHGVAESLAPDAGALVPAGDVDALARAVVARLADPTRAADEGVAGRRFAEARLDVRRTVDEIARRTAELAHCRATRGVHRAVRPES